MEPRDIPFVPWDQWVMEILHYPLGHVVDLASGDGEFVEEFLALDSKPSSVTLIDLDPNSIAQAKAYFSHHGPQDIPFFYWTGDILEVMASLDAGDAGDAGDSSDAYSDRNSTNPRSDILVIDASDARDGSHTQAHTTWDSLLLGLALHHLNNPKELLSQLPSRLNPGGRLIISEVVGDSDLLNPAQITARDMHHLKAQVDRLLGISHRETYSLQEVIALLPPLEWNLTLTPDPQDDPSVLDISGQTKDNEHRIEFLRDYLLHAKHFDTYPILRREFSRLRYQITMTGYQLPPRLNGILSLQDPGGALDG